MGRSSSERVAIGFMVVWLVFWGAGMLVVLWALAHAALARSLPGVLFMLVWLAAAGFGLWQGARKLRQLVEVGRVPRPARDRAWRDGLGPSGADRR